MFFIKELICHFRARFANWARFGKFTDPKNNLADVSYQLLLKFGDGTARYCWVCSKCENLNYSNVAQSKSNYFTSRNSYSTLSEESSESSKPTSPSLLGPNANRIFLDENDLKVLNINC